MTRSIRRALVVAAGLSLVGAAPADHVTRLAVPGAVNQYVSLASIGSVVAAVWAATPARGETAIYAALSPDAGQTFGKPVRVATRADVGGEQPPRVVLTSGGESGAEVVVVWTAKTDEGTRLLTSRSRNRGVTFSPPAVVAGTTAPGNRGWESVAVDAGGHPIVAWLDHREGAVTSETGHHHGDETAPADASAAEQSVARAATSRIYVGSADGSVPVQGLVHGVCYCCKTAIAATRSGEVMLAWRHVYPGGYRDIAFSMSSRGNRTFSAPVRVSQDGWQIAGCPEDGPALAIDAARRAHVVWPTLVKDGGRERMTLFHASTADGKTFSPRSPLPIGDSAFHPQVVVTSAGEVVSAWDEGSGGTRRIRLAHGRVDSRGATTFALSDDFGPEGDHPALAVVPNGVVIAYAGKNGAASEIQLVVRRF